MVVITLCALRVCITRHMLTNDCTANSDGIKKQGEFTVFNDHNESLLRRQPRGPMASNQ